MRQRSSMPEQPARRAIQPGVSELTDEQWNRVYKSVLYQLDTNEYFRSDTAVDIAEAFSLEDYEEWFREVVEWQS